MNDVTVQGRNNAASHLEVVVASKHLDRVRAALDDRGVRFWEPEEPDPDLGLGLIRLENDAAAAYAFRKYDKEWKNLSPKRRGQEAATPDGKSSKLLDSFLRGLRGYFAQQYAGWTPVVGKNRVVRHVVSTYAGGDDMGKIRHTGDDPPVSAASRQAGGDRQDMGKIRHTGDEPPLVAGQPSWAYGRGGRGVVVGIIDTTIANMPALAGRWITPPGEIFEPLRRQARDSRGEKTMDPSAYPNVAAGHATFLAGLILQYAPNCEVRLQPVLDDDGTATLWAVAKAIVALAATKPDIINLSLVCCTEDGEPPLALETAINRVGRDTVIVAAAGNHGDLRSRPLTKAQLDALIHDLPRKERKGAGSRKELEQLAREKASQTPGWPAAFDRLIAVGSGESADSPDRFTPQAVAWIDVMVRGDKVASTFPSGYYSYVKYDERGRGTPDVVKLGGNYARWSGTSFAAAKVSGLIAALTVPGRRSAREVADSYVPPTPGYALQPLPGGPPVSTTAGPRSGPSDGPPFIDM